jgi:hypothetical protein
MANRIGRPAISSGTDMFTSASCEESSYCRWCVHLRLSMELHLARLAFCKHCLLAKLV